MICSYLEFLELSGQSILAESLYGVFPVLLGLEPKKHPSSVWMTVLASIPIWNSECFFQVLLSIHTILFIIQLKLINLFLRGSFVKKQPAKTSVSPRSSPLKKFRAEERLRLSDRNSILMTQINVYTIPPVVMEFQQ